MQTLKGDPMQLNDPRKWSLAFATVVLTTIFVYYLYAQPQINAPTGLTVLVDGVLKGTATSLNLVSGNGGMWVCAINTQTPSQMDCNYAVNSAVYQSLARAQSRSCSTIVATSNGSGQFSFQGGSTCLAFSAMPPVGATYTLILSDAPNSVGAFSLNLDNLGTFAVKTASGSTLVDPAPNSVVQGLAYTVTLIKAPGTNSLVWQLR